MPVFRFIGSTRGLQHRDLFRSLVPYEEEAKVTATTFRVSDGTPGNHALMTGEFSFTGAGTDIEHLRGGTVRTLDLVQGARHMQIVGHDFSMDRYMEMTAGQSWEADHEGLRDMILGGNDRVYATEFHDNIDTAAGNDTVWGGEGHDGIMGDQGADKLFGGTGDDTLHGEDDNDQLYGDAGLDDLYGGAGKDRLYGGDGDDLLSGGTGIDILEGGAGADMLFGGDDKDRLSGGAGDDRLDGGAATDLLWGEAGNDYLEGGADLDRLYGGSGADTLIGGTGNDLIVGGAGADVLSGGAGVDTFLFNTSPFAAQADTFLDFVSADDQIRLQQSAFDGIGALRHLGAARFAEGTAALDADDRVIYDKASGRLWFDRDGTGDADAILFARFDAQTVVTHQDFLVTG